jgi:hypothetical protein
MKVSTKSGQKRKSTQVDPICLAPYSFIFGEAISGDLKHRNYHSKKQNVWKQFQERTLQ